MVILKLGIIPLILSLAACGSDVSDSRLNIVNGLEASAKDFPAVVKIQQIQPDGSSWGCTASFISPSLAITAGHCIEMVRSNVTVNGVSAKNFFRPQKYNSEWYNYDVAIINMGANVASDFIPLSCNPPVKNDELTIVGFGKTDLYNDTNHFTKKHYGTNKVDQVYQGRITFTAPDKPSNPPTGQNVLNGLGDSGGPMIVNGKIVGVSSSVSVADPGFERTGNYTNINYAPIKSFFNGLKTNNGLNIECK